VSGVRSQFLHAVSETTINVNSMPATTQDVSLPVPTSAAPSGQE
jgi:hypothetical protein